MKVGAKTGVKIRAKFGVGVGVGFHDKAGPGKVLPELGFWGGT